MIIVKLMAKQHKHHQNDFELDRKIQFVIRPLTEVFHWIALRIFIFINEKWKRWVDRNMRLFIEK